MRIGLIIYGTLQTESGGFLYDRRLVTHLRQAGDKVHIISLPWRDYKYNLLDNLSAFTVRKIRELDLDMLLQDELNHPSLIVLNHTLAGRKRCLKISIVHHLHMNEQHTSCRALKNWVEKTYLKSVDGFIFNSRATAATVARYSGEKPSVVAYPGKNRFSPKITSKQIAARAQRKGPLCIIFLGNITPRKGLTTLIRSLQSLPRDEWKLTVIGSLDRDKAYSQKIIDRVGSNRWEENIIITGQISDAEVAAHLYTHHVLAVPSYYEGYGIVYVEAMGFGLPVIGTNAGGTSEIIEHSVNGFLTTPGDDSTLAQYLKRLNADRAMLERMSMNALRAYQKFPTWQDTTTKIRDFLCAMISQHSFNKFNYASID